MASTTTNFGFDIPTSSDLVKNGATAIGTLGQDIDTFLAGSPTSTAGKNKIINGDFSVWQRGTSFSSIANAAYGPDRYAFGTTGDVVNVTQQAFSAGDLTVTGYGSPKYFCRMQVVSSNGSARMIQKIEDVQTLANQVVTVSFWAKANVTTSLDIYISQNFGTGGSTTVTSAVEVVSLTTSWVRYSKNITLASITGKTIGAGNHLSVEFRETTASTTVSFDFWGIQVETGSTLTNFQTASGGSPQAELAMCQRYYFRYASSQYVGVGHLQSSGFADFLIKTPVTMRGTPTYAAASGTSFFQVGSAAATNSYSTVNNFYSSGTDTVLARINVSGYTAGQGCAVVMGSASAWVEGSAEL